MAGLVQVPDTALALLAPPLLRPFCPVSLRPEGRTTTNQISVLARSFELVDRGTCRQGGGWRGDPHGTSSETSKVAISLMSDWGSSLFSVVVGSSGLASRCCTTAENSVGERDEREDDIQIKENDPSNLKMTLT